MPELPDLQVIREFLAPRIVGVPIVAARVLRPIPVRNLLGGDIVEHLIGRQFTGVDRRGKFLILPLDAGATPASATPAGATLVINPMLAGRIRYGQPLARDRVRDVLVLDLGDGNAAALLHELRYHDAKDMGKLYLTDDLDQIPTYADQGPEADDPDLTLDLFRQRLRRHPGEIKWILTGQRFVAGIGNAYADEILWRAGIYPFRRRPSLSEDEIAGLYAAMREVLAEALATLRRRVGADIDVEIRDFLAVHGKAGEPCPRCGGTVSEVKRERRATHFCRTCQPGLMLRR